MLQAPQIHINIGYPIAHRGFGLIGMNPMLQLMQNCLQMMMSFMAQGPDSIGLSLSNPQFGPPGCYNGGSCIMNFLGAPAHPRNPTLPSKISFLPHPAFGPGVRLQPAPCAPRPIRLTPGSQGGGRRAVQVARQFIGQRSWDIKGRMPYFRRAGGLGRNCADFVSAALQNGGMLGGHEVNVGRLEKRLLKEGWVRIPNSQAGPGDVAITPTRSHVELCQGFGKTIGSNNSNKRTPKVQYVTERKLRKKMIIYRKA